MLKFENTRVTGWAEAIRGMRNPMNSWAKSDSYFKDDDDYSIGHADFNLMRALFNAGTDHRKFLRMVTVYVDITGPLYWWKEFDTYKVGTVANSCSTMHTIHKKPFVIEDFSMDSLLDDSYWRDGVNSVIGFLNDARFRYLCEEDAAKKKLYWRKMIQFLPSSYNQKRTIMMNYEVLANIYRGRKDHKLDEWAVDFFNWIDALPYSTLIRGDF